MSVVATAALDREFAQKGTVTARPGQAVQVLGEDVTGWSSVLWSIRSYPETFEARGWTLNESTGAYESTAVRPPAFQLPTEPAKIDIDLTVDGVTDSSLRLVVPSRIGLVDTALAEGTTRSGFRGFVRDINRNWRLIERAFAAKTSSSKVDTVDYQTFQAALTTPAWYVAGSFRLATSSVVKLRLVGCLSSTSLTMRGRLFDTSSTPPAPIATMVSITNSIVSAMAESAAITLAANHTYQLQVEVTGGNAETDFGALHLFQPIDQ